ncbi:hypothetical protein Tco_0961132 [Tanacetum coccineum]
MNSLNSKCTTSFVKPQYLKKAQSSKPCMYDIACYRDNLANMFAFETDETIRLAEESQFKLEWCKQTLKEEMAEDLGAVCGYGKSNDVWNDYINVKSNKDKGKWRTKSFPHFEELCVAFGKNRARGNEAKDFADSEKEATVEVIEFDEELDTMMKGNHNVPHTPAAQVDDTTSIKVDKNTKVSCKKRKRQTDPLVDGLHDVAKLLSDTLNKSAMTMSRDIDFEEDLKKKRGMITNEIFKMTSLNQQEKYEVMEKIRSDGDS